MMFLLSVFASAAATCSGLTLDLRPGVADLNNQAAGLSVRVSRTGTALGCQFFVTFDYGDARISPPGRRVETGDAGVSRPVGLFKDAAATQPLTTLSDAISPANVLSGALTSGTAALFTDLAYFAKTDQALRAPGIYAESFTVSLYAGVPGDAVLVTSRRLTLHRNEAPRAVLSIEGADAVVRANTDHKVTLTSSKGRALPDLPAATDGVRRIPLPKSEDDETLTLTVSAPE